MRIMQGYHRSIAARVFEHALLERMAAVADVPIVNMLSDHSHPLQALADALTMEQALGPLAGRKVAWVGDYNNVARSLGEISALLGAHVALRLPARVRARRPPSWSGSTLLGAATVEHAPARRGGGATAPTRCTPTPGCRWARRARRRPGCRRSRGSPSTTD